MGNRRDHRHRYMLAKRAGATSLNQDEWKLVVERAVEATEAAQPKWLEATMPMPDQTRARGVYIMPDQLVVDARLILNVEAALADALEVQLELLELAKDDMNEARKARLLRTIDRARETIAKRLAIDPS